MNFSTPILGLFTLSISYLLGSIPSGYIAGRWLAQVDIRQLGSGSTGATNVLRHFGKVPALVVFLIDVGKGIAAVLIAKNFQLNDNWQVIAGLLSVVGHIWPIWLGWKGGKAVATGLGMLLGLSWPVGLSCLGVFLTVLSFSKIVSLSSVITALSLPLLMVLSFHGNIYRPAYLALSVVTMAIVIWRHRSNIKRLWARTEPKIGESH